MRMQKECPEQATMPSQNGEATTGTRSDRCARRSIEVWQIYWQHHKCSEPVTRCSDSIFTLHTHAQDLDVDRAKVLLPISSVRDALDIFTLL